MLAHPQANVYLRKIYSYVKLTLSYMKKGNWLLYLLAGISLLVFTAGVAYLGFSSFRGSLSLGIKPVTTVNGKKPAVDPSLPKTAACPLNGMLYTEGERKTWETRRPLAAMIENHVDARPLAGLNNADVVYEAVAEGGITRFMGIFYCGVAAEDIQLAPVRSARIYFVRIVPEYDALYNHVGGAGNCNDPTVDDRAKALCFIGKYKIHDMDEFGLGFKQCHRVTNRTNRDVAYEHTMSCYTNELYDEAANRGWTNIDTNLKTKPAWNQNFVSWKFKDDATTKGAVTDIHFDFWASQTNYSAGWKYDPTTNAYLRSTGGEVAVDQNTNEQESARNIVIEFVKESGPLDEHMHMYYENIGTGKMMLFQDGQVYTGTWAKAAVTSRTIFTLDSGKQVEFNKGRIWVELVPSGNNIIHN